MKHLLCGSLVMFLVLAGQGQAQTYQHTQEYCEFEAEPVFASNKCYARVDYGQARSRGLFYEVEKLGDPQTQEILEFNSAIDILNYMSAQGWELVRVYVIDSVDERYLLRRSRAVTSGPEGMPPNFSEYSETTLIHPQGHTKASVAEW